MVEWRNESRNRGKRESRMTLMIERPTENEYAPYAAGYVRRVTDGNVFGLFARQIGMLHSMLSPLDDEQANFRFGPGEWSIKEAVGHINDAERIFAYRALRISRNDQAPLAGFEQDDYVREANFGECALGDLLDEFELLRRANILAFSRLSDEALLRCGTASGKPVSVRALLYIMAGHVEHHIESFKNDYLAKL